MALAGLGVWLVARAAPAGGEAGGPSWEGYGLALVAGVTWGAFTLACQGLRPAAPGRVAGGLVTMSAVMLGTALLLLPALGWNPAWPRTAAQWGWCGVLAVVHTALANVLWRLALEHIGAFAASLVFLLTIVFTMVNGALFLDEPVTWPLGLGAAAIVSAVFVGRSRATATSRAPDCAAATRGPPPR
jgi:drug/metabolite transporter (DMT)-like permease